MPRVYVRFANFTIATKKITPLLAYKVQWLAWLREHTSLVSACVRWKIHRRYLYVERGYVKSQSLYRNVLRWVGWERWGKIAT